jgi:hypothetical protein
MEILWRGCEGPVNTPPALEQPAVEREGLELEPNSSLLAAQLPVASCELEEVRVESKPVVELI